MTKKRNFSKQLHNNIILLQPLRLNYERERERERERVKSLRDFDLEFHTFNNLKCYFYSAFLILQNYV